MEQDKNQRRRADANQNNKVNNTRSSSDTDNKIGTLE